MAYLPLSTANLPDPVIDPAQGSSPDDYFGTLTWSGNDTGTTRTIADGQSGITGDVNFTPDFVWSKDRTTGYSHVLYDTVRGLGANKELNSDQTTIEGGSNPDTYGYLSSVTDGGFITTAGSNGPADNLYFNNSGDTYVSWCWKAGTSVSGSTGGSGTSKSYTGSVSTESGFSIIRYQGNATAGHTIPHNLNSAPEMVIVKDLDGLTNWGVGHNGINGGSNPWDYKLHLDLTNAQSDDINVWNDTAPTSSVVTLGAGGIPNGNDVNYIMYCFHSVEGFSKFGSYTGNGSADGVFVFCGFRPAFVMLKKTNGAGDWNIRDTSRSPNNVVGEALYPNLSFVEYSGTETYIDIVSNGFKLRGNWNSSNASGGTYIYMAFAENPFKYSNAR